MDTTELDRILTAHVAKRRDACILNGHPILAPQSGCACNTIQQQLDGSFAPSFAFLVRDAKGKVLVRGLSKAEALAFATSKQGLA